MLVLGLAVGYAVGRWHYGGSNAFIGYALDLLTVAFALTVCGTVLWIVAWALKGTHVFA
jgi:hypothetical protein